MHYMIWVARLKDRLLRPESSLLHVATLMTGSLLAQGLAVLLTPLIARLYTPDDFGVFAIFTSVLSILSVVACWRFELAIVMPESDDDAINLVALSLLASFVTGICLFLLAGLIGETIAKLLGSPRLAQWLWLLPLSVIASGSYQSLNYLATRRKQFKAVSASQVGQTGSNAVLQVCAGFAQTGPVGLIGSQLIGQCAANLILCRMGMATLRGVFRVVSWADIRRLAGLYRKYPLFNTWPSLLNILASMLPVMFLSKVFGEETTGQFSLAMRVVTIPLTLVGASVAQVMLPRFARDRNDCKATADLIEKTVSKLLLIAGGLFGLLLLSPLIFTPIFGSKWAVAGTFAQILAVSVAVKFVVSPVSVVLLTCNRQDILAYWQVIYVVATLAMLMVSRMFMKPELTVFFVSIADVLLYLFYLYLILKVSGARIQKVYVNMLAILKKENR